MGSKWNNLITDISQNNMRPYEEQAKRLENRVRRNEIGVWIRGLRHFLWGFS